MKVAAKKCSRCQFVKATVYFYNDKSRKDGFSNYCRACKKAYSAGKYIEYKPRISAQQRQKKFGISKEEYARRLFEQNYSCSICNATHNHLNKGLVVDHDHQTGRIRGLLCGNCNTALGLFKEDFTRIYNAIAYLEGKEYGKKAG